MKKTITLLLLLLSAVTATAQAWENVAYPGFTYSSTSFTTVKVDPAGTPYIAYIDGSNQKPRVMKFNGTSWENVGAPGFSAGTADYLTFELDASGTPYVAYRDYTIDYKITVMKFDGTSWISVGLPGISADFTGMNALAIDSNGTPYVAFQDIYTFNIIVMKYNGTGWENAGNGLPGRGDYLSLALSAGDIPYIAFQDYNASYIKSTVRKLEGNEWVIVGAQGEASENTSYYNKIAIDASGIPYLAYVDSTIDYRTTVRKFNGSNWENVGPSGISVGSSWFNSLAINSSGTPYIAFTDDGMDTPGVTVLKFNGSAWENAGISGMPAGDSSFPSIAFDAADTLYVGYGDLNYNNRATVLKLVSPPQTQLKEAYCGSTQNGFGTNLYAAPVPSATQYRFRVIKGDNVQTIDKDNNYFRLNQLASYAWDTTYTVDVAVGINGIFGAYGPACSVTVAPATTQLNATSCGSTVTGFGTNLYANALAFADGYRFRVRDGENVQTIDKTVSYFRLKELESYHYNRTYTVEVAVSIDGDFGEFGPACSVNVGPAISQLTAASCGSTVERFGTNIYAIPVPLADSYRFQVSDGEHVETINKVTSYFRLSELDSYEYGKTYTVEVAVSIDVIFGQYGPACTITTPPAPLTQLRAQDCGTTIAKFSTNLYADNVMLAQGYRFRVTNGDVVNIVDRPNRNFRISMLPSYTNNTTYTVEVAVLIDGIWGDFGPACEVSTPFMGVRMNLANDQEAVRELTAFPNPFETSFTLALETESNEPVTIQAYDIAGKMLDNRTVAPEELSGLSIGENYAAGIYSLIVTQGSYTKVVKMVKK